jgi:hypothetical protein
MSYRVSIKIKNDNNVLFSEQIFGNNTSIPYEMIKGLSLNIESDGFLEETEITDKKLFLELFKNYYFKLINDWIEEDSNGFLNSFKDLNRYTWLIPDWSIYGSFSYSYTSMNNLIDNKFFISAG